MLVNNATLGGHVEIGEHAILGGLAAVQQHCRIGAHAFIGGLSGVNTDVIPFASAIGERAELGGLNVVGLKRRGFDRPTIHALRAAYQAIFNGGGTRAERVERRRREIPGRRAGDDDGRFHPEERRPPPLLAAGVTMEPAPRPSRLNSVAR